MLADIICVIIGVRVVETTVAISWHVLLIFGPTNALLIQEVHNRGHIGWDIFQDIVIQSPEVTSPGGDVIGLARVCQAIVTCESDTLCREVLEDCLRGCSGEVGVFEPDLDVAIENGTRYYGRVLNGSVRRADIERRRVSGTDGPSG